MDPKRFAFIIRLWQEDAVQTETWRGSLQLVAANQRDLTVYFQQFEEIPDLLHYLMSQATAVVDGEDNDT